MYEATVIGERKKERKRGYGVFLARAVVHWWGVRVGEIGVDIIRVGFSKDQGVAYLVVLITVIGKVFYETGRLLL